MKTLKEQWAEFAECLPPEASKQQRWDMEVAFYAGAASLHSMILTDLTPGDDVETSDIAMMENIETELTEFQIKLDKYIIQTILGGSIG